jgi:hypothetical protein
MPTLSPEFVYQILVMLATAGTVYGGIRSDIKGMLIRIKANETAIEEGRQRMDNHIERRHA